MADEKDTKTKAAAKKPAAKKADAAPKKDAAPKADAAKKAAPAKAKKPAGKTIKITQIGSPAGRQAYQRATLIGLGLNKMHKSRELEDTPSVRGMINSIPHLVKIEDDAA